MAVTTRLIGRLGGSAEVVTQEKTTTSRYTVTLPEGWGSAWCIYQGIMSANRTSVQIFGRTTAVSAGQMAPGTAVGGGILLEAPDTTEVGFGTTGTLTMIRMT